ncbi:unnamed protein product [Aphis gossypii]|nr:unnamed protein product [Aphis gossypii]
MMVNSVFQLIYQNIQTIHLPNNWYCNKSIEYIEYEPVIAFHKLSAFKPNYKRHIEKQVVLNEGCKVILHINDKEVTPSDIGLPDTVIKNIEDLKLYLYTLDEIKFCQGAVSSTNYPDIRASFGTQYIESNGYWRHNKCLIVLNDDNSKCNVCSWCKRLVYSIQKKHTNLLNKKTIRTFYSPNKNKIHQRLLKSTNIIRKKNKRTQIKKKVLQNQLNQMKNEMKNITEKNLDELLMKSNISPGQCEMVKEIYSASKVKNPKNRRYNENWMLLCLLFQIRSPGGYKFLREQNLLPLPCVTTLRKHLLAVKIGCGFDEKFFKLLKKKFDVKNKYEKKVILVYDEIFLRENISVNSRTLTYHGLEDLGDDFENKSLEKANHALVLMIQGLAENLHQPIAVFTSRGSVKGIDLAKIVTKAILLLENAGVEVLGITSDGASNNRTLWNVLGVSGKLNQLQNSFVNPFDNTRRVFVFSDVPHLLKTIRNRLHAKKTLQICPTLSPIQWKIYENVFEIDSKAITRVCPKLTKNHFQLDNFSKMKVKYASQVFSKSMADGIVFFKSKNFPGFNCSEETVKFTLFINDLFDALNRKFPSEGIRKDSKDLQVSQKCCFVLHV